MYKIPLTNSPNQKFTTTVPVNEGNIDFDIELRYNEIAEYWTMTLIDTQSRQIIFSQLPLLSSFFEYANIAHQFQYKNIGSIYIVPMQMTKACRPNNIDIGKKYILIWGDNEVE